MAVLIEETSADMKAKDTQAIADDAQKDLNEALPALVSLTRNRSNHSFVINTYYFVFYYLKHFYNICFNINISLIHHLKLECKYFAKGCSPGKPQDPQQE